MKHATSHACFFVTVLQEFGRAKLSWASTTGVPGLLGVAPAVWQATLAVWKQSGVADPHALALRNCQAVTVNWLLDERWAVVSLLQQALPGQPSTAEVIEECAGYIGSTSFHRAQCRLEELQDWGLLHRFVLRKRGMPDSRQLVSLCDVSCLTDSAFGNLVDSLRGDRLPGYHESLDQGEELAREVALQLPPRLLAEASQAQRSGKDVRRIADGPQLLI